MQNKPERPRSDDGADHSAKKKRSRREAADWLTKPADPFDLWLRDGLRKAFNHVCAEPIPEEIMQLVEEDRAERERIRLARLARQRK